MILNFVGGVQTLSKIHGLETDYDFSNDGHNVRVYFTNPITKKRKLYIVHLRNYKDVEEAVSDVGDFIADSGISKYVS